MANKTIKISLSESSIKDALKQIRDRKKWVQTKTEELIKRISTMAVTEAEAVYGNTPITLSVVQEPNKLTIHANGKAVCFIEFGAGVTTYTSHPYANAMPFDVAPGSWSVQDAQEFYLYGKWHFGGVVMDRVEPRPGMYRAARIIQDKVYDIAKEVFKE